MEIVSACLLGALLEIFRYRWLGRVWPDGASSVVLGLGVNVSAHHITPTNPGLARLCLTGMTKLGQPTVLQLSLPQLSSASLPPALVHLH